LTAISDSSVSFPVCMVS